MKWSRKITWLVAVAFLWVASFPRAVQGQISEPNLHRLLETDKWSEEDRAALERGDVVVRTLPTADKQELASMGVVRFRDLSPVALEVFRESVSQRSSGTRQAGGRFSSPATPEDLRELVLDEDTVEQLRKCSVGNCDLNLSSESINRFQALFDGSASDPAASALFRETLARLVNEYSAMGDRALGSYENRRKGVDLAAAHRSLLAGSSLLHGMAPEVAEYMVGFPQSRLHGIESSLGWSVLDFGLKPSITVSHTVAYAGAGGDADSFVLVSKQIYSSRYLDSSLATTFLVRSAGNAGMETYLIFADRSRSDVLDGPLGGLARSTIQKESMKRIAEMLGRAQLRLIAGARPDLTASDAVPTETSAYLTRSRILLLATGAIVLAAILILWGRLRRRSRI